MAGRGGVVFFRGRTGRVFFFFRGGTGRFFFFSEAGRGGFFFFSTGRDGAVFFSFRVSGRDVCFWRWHFFWRDGAKSLHRPAKGGLNRRASRPCKALQFLKCGGIRGRESPRAETAQGIYPVSVVQAKIRGIGHQRRISSSFPVMSGVQRTHDERVSPRNSTVLSQIELMCVQGETA